MNNNKEEIEIDLLELSNKLWDNKKNIIKCSIIGAIVGIVIAFSIPKEYTTTVILATESGKSAGGSMGALASMAGISLGGAAGDDILSPELYPDVLSSTPFVQGLLSITVVDERNNIDTTLYSYIKDFQVQTWWSYIFKAPSNLISMLSSTKSDSISGNIKSRYIDREEMTLIEKIRNSSTISTNKKNGITTIEFTAQSPQISAFLADTLTSYLQFYIIEQRTKKSKMSLENSIKLYDQAQLDYYKAQQNLASFIDANKNVISAKYKINQEKLQNETSLTYSVYNQMAQQVQMNKIKIQDETPVFSIIQPALEPLEASSPRRKLIVIGFIFLSLIGSSLWIIKNNILDAVFS